MSASPDGPGPYGGSEPGPGTEGAEKAVAVRDQAALDGLRSMWEQLDPVPDGLADRVAFALEVEALAAGEDDLDLELMRLVQEQPALSGSRGEAVRTVTFGSESTTVMLALSDVAGGYRVDGWVAPGGRRRVEARTAGGTTAVECDSTGRFTLPLVPPGHFQLVLDGGTGPVTGPDGGAEGGPGPVRRAMVTPALTL